MYDNYQSNQSSRQEQQPVGEPRPVDASQYIPQPYPSYGQGYQPAPPQYYPHYPHYPQQSYPMQQPPMYAQQPYQQQMMAPQMMMPPQVVINNSMNIVGRQQINVWIRILYFLLIGLPLGTMWAMLAATFCCTFIGLGIGIMMFRSLPAIFTLQR